MGLDDDKIIINEAQLILAEKRTSLAALRTGIAVFALPLAISSLLIVTSKHYNFFKVLSFLLPIGIICMVLSVLGMYLIIRAVIKIHAHDGHIKDLKKKNKILREYID